MRVVIYEPNQLGHRLDFVRLIAGGLVDLGIRPTWVTSEDATSSEQAKVHLGALASGIDVETTATPVDDLTATNARVRFADVRRIATDPATDWVYVPFADHIAQLAALPGAWPSRASPVEGLMFRGRYAYPVDRFRDRALAAASLRAATASPWQSLFVLDPLATEALTERGEDGAARLMPDPVEQRPRMDSQTARASLGIREADRVLVLAGAIDERKGAVELARAFAISESPDDVVLAFIGKVSPAIADDLARFARADDRIVVIDRHLDGDEFWAALSSADVLCATYANHVGSSGIVAQAAYLGTPLLASDYGWVGEATRRYGLGVTVDTLDVASLRSGVEAVTNGPLESTRTDASEVFVSFNTPERFVETWLSAIKAQL